MLFGLAESVNRNEKYPFLHPGVENGSPEHGGAVGNLNCKLITSCCRAAESGNRRKVNYFSCLGSIMGFKRKVVLAWKIRGC